MKKFFIIFINFCAIFVLLLNIYQDSPGSLVVSSENTEELKVPIIMYHSILNNYKKAGKYIITPAQLEKDLLCLAEHNYNTITTEELINYVYYLPFIFFSKFKCILRETTKVTFFYFVLQFY